MPWERFRYRGHKAWLLVDERGELVLDDRDLAALRYRVDDERTYSVRPADVRPLEAGGEAASGVGTGEPIEVWAEARVGGETEPAGIGIVLVWGERRREIQRTIDPAPLPQAGVVAVLEALQAIRRPKLPVRVHTPHVETVRALRGGGRGGARTPLARELRRTLRRFPKLVLAPPGPSDAAPEARRAADLARRAAGVEP